jgi:hypothetical protein
MENQEEKAQRIYSKTNVDRFFNNLIKGKGNFLVRFGTECNELIFDNVHNVFATKNKNFPPEFICLFNMVKTDVKKFLKVNPIVNEPIKVNVTQYNYGYKENDDKLTATDLDHAFWRIAYVKGYISKKTYIKGLDSKAKAIRLASLSVLGREKKFDKYIDGVHKGTITYTEPDETLKKVFVDIRFSCYYMMYELSEILKDDFDCYKTDCIYYRDTPKNRKLVHDYFDERNMLYKQLIF